MEENRINRLHTVKAQTFTPNLFEDRSFMVKFLTFLLCLAHAGSSSIPSYDVAIIGAGPAGLATAIGIQRSMGPNTSIVIYERSSALQQVGGQVGLIAPAFRALDCLDHDDAKSESSLSQAVTMAGVHRSIFRMLDVNNNIVKENQVDKNAKQVVIAWFKLQQVLCDEFRRGVREGVNQNQIIQLGHELKTFEEDEDSNDVLLSFENGHQCRAKIVIGADGNMSKVRATLFQSEGETFPDYAGSCIWRMFLIGDYDGIQIGESNVWTGDGKVLAAQKMGSGADSRLYVSGQAGWPKDQLHVLDRKRYIGVEDGKDSGGCTWNKDRLERFLDAFKDFPSDVLDFARKYHDTASILEHPIYFRPINREWGKGRVTLVGDAAHMIPPNMAMGTPLAFEDSVSLATNLHRHGLTPKALRAYETERQPRVNKIAYKAIKDSGAYYTEKDDNANPFKLNDKDMLAYITNFRQDPIPHFDHVASDTREL